MIGKQVKGAWVIVAVCMASLTLAGDTVEKKVSKQKLQIVLLLGQSNMVGLADVMTAWYLTQPQYVPPEKVALMKSRYFDWEYLYWEGLRTFKGPQACKDALRALYFERAASRSKWRQRINGANGIEWNEKEWGKKPAGGRGNIYPFLDQKAEEEGIYKRIAEILDRPENEFTPEVAYREILERDAYNAEDIRRVREVYLNGTTGEDFDRFAAALDEVKFNKRPTQEVEAERARYAELAKKHVHLPVAEHTRIYGYGAIAGSEGEGIKSITQGPLSVGYGGGLTTIGPEYGVGITLDRMVDGPVLLVKCSWGNTSLADAWRPESLDGVETPAEKARREAWNSREAERAKAEGREFTARPAPEKRGRPGWCWTLAWPQIEKVLADPGKYYPGYDPAVGYDVAGLVWFQGYSDMNNSAYGELLVEMIKEVRQKVKSPNMVVVCGALGMNAFKHLALAGDVNGGMVYASQHPDLKGTVDVVSTARYYPVELNLIGLVKKNYDKESEEYKQAEYISKRAISNKGFHYHGSAKCFILMGDAMGRSLVNLLAGGKPFIDAELERVKEVKGTIGGGDGGEADE